MFLVDGDDESTGVGLLAPKVAKFLIGSHEHGRQPLAAGVERMGAIGPAPDEVRLVGGAARNPLWQGILATAFGVPVRVLEETETAAVGAALQAAAAVRGVPADELAQGFVAFAGPPVDPTTDAATRERMAGLRERLSAAVAGLRG